MWLFTNQGFISVVADRNDPESGNLLVRSRDRDHLVNLFPNAEIFSKTPSDYRWRAWTSREEVAKLMLEQVSNLSYTNFKNSIRDEKYHEACIDVWDVVYFAYRD